MSQSNKTEENKPSIWVRLKKLSLTITVVVCLLFSFTNHMDLEKYKKTVGPIGTNPPQYSPVRLYSAELGTEHLHPPVNFLTDTIVGHNYSTNMLTRLGTVNDIRNGLATTASLSGYTTSSALSAALSSYATTTSLSGYVPTSRVIIINGVPMNLSADRSWTIPTTTYSAGTGLSLTGTTFANTAPDQTVNLTAGNRVSITGTYPNYTISYVEPTINIATRTVNNNYTISTTRQATVFYSITATTTNPLLLGTSAGTAFLEYSTNGGTTWLNPTQVSSTSAVGVTVTVALTTGNTSTLAGVIPANALVRIRTTTSGTATVVYATGQETY